MELYLNGDEYTQLLKLLVNNCSKTDECCYCGFKDLCDNICDLNLPVEELEEFSIYGI